MTPRPILHIVSNADEKFLPGLELAVASAVAAASGQCDYQFLIIDGGIPREKLVQLKATASSIAARRGIHADLTPLKINPSRLLAFPERRGSRMTYAKLVLPEMLPHLDSIVYLDADVLCFKGLEEVHPPAGESQWQLAGVRDFFGELHQDCPWLDQIPKNERHFPYINCGIKWMNLEALREADLINKAVDAIAQVGDTRYGDQTLFNFLCRGKCHILQEALNHRTSIGSNRTLCEGNLDLNLHYIGAPKPWLGPPKTCNWLAHSLWHQARAALFPNQLENRPNLPPHDLSTIRRKAMLYTLINPSRAVRYRSDIRSLVDPGGVLALAKQYWNSRA